MKIAINALGVDGGGGQTYLEAILPELDALDTQNDYVILLRKNHSVSLPALSKRFKIALIPVRQPSWLWRVVIEQLSLPYWLKKEKIDLLYSPADATSLLAPCPVVLAMRNPNLYVKMKMGWPLRYRLKFAVLSIMARLSTKKATQIIFVSEASRALATQRIPIPPEKINIVYHGVGAFFFKKSPPPASDFQKKSPYILSVSSIYRYKNYVRLIQAFAQIKDKLPKKYHLIIIGSSFDNDYYHTMKQTIKALGLEDRVHHLVGYTVQELPAVYQNASLFVFPSFLETFGHTLVEAMASQVPIAAADIEPTREITAGAALYFDPFQVQAIAAAIQEGLTNEQRRKDLVQRGSEQVKKFSWKICAEQTLKIFRKAVSGARITGAPRESRIT